MSYTQDNLYFTVNSPLGKDTLLFKEMNGEERLSDLFHFHLQMLSESSELSMEQIVGKRMTLVMRFAEGHQRYFNGVVSRFVQGGGDPRFSVYYADLRPWLWLLTLSCNCRIFQKMSVPDIIEQIFTDAGESDYRNELKGSYPEREYCVQYHESDFAFVTRLMADEGIFYYFEHEDGIHTLVMADDLDAHPDCPGLPEAIYQRAENLSRWEDAVTSCTFSQQVTTGAYEVDDFNFETPSLDLCVSTTGERGEQSIYEYDAGFETTGEGEKIAKRRMQACEWNNRLLEGKGYCFSFVAGHRFTLQEHPSESLNQAYILHSVSHTLSFNHYSNSFCAFPAEVLFRPPLIPNKPRIYGTQTAIVTGKSGEEIWTDKYGRIKVQFHWDREGKKDENSSCWIRVNQGWAGKGWGSYWLPRIGQEVIISYLNGDPDYPLVTGAVYNAEQVVPYALPEHKSRSTIKSRSTKEDDGFNEMRFEDKVGEEEYYMHAQKDMNIDVLNNQTSTIHMNRLATIEEEDDELVVAKGSRTTTIHKNRTTTIEEEDDTLTVAKGQRKETIKKNHEVTIQDGDRIIKVEKGAENHSIKKNYTIKVDGDLLIDVKGKVTIKAGQSIETKAGTSMTHKAGTSMESKAGTSLANKAGTSLENKAGTSLDNKAGTTLTNKANISVTNEANATLTNKANATLTNESSGMMTHKTSGLQKVEASGMTMVKGAIVMIN